MDTDELYRLADENGIEVYFASLPICGSCSIEDDGYMSVGIDPRICDTQATEKERLAHELGHCIYGGFITRHTNPWFRKRTERNAQKWAEHRLVPFDALMAAFRKGVIEVWELAEHFGVGEDFVRNVISTYRGMGLLTGLGNE